MGDYGYEDDDFDEHEDSGRDAGPQGLRAHLKSLERQVKKLQQSLEEKDKTISELTVKTRGASLADILRSKGVNPKISGLIPASVEATEEAVTNWLNEYKDVLPLEAKTTVDPAADKREQAADDKQLLPDPHLFDEGEDEDQDDLEAMRQVFETVQRATRDATPGGQRQDITSRLTEIGESTESFDAAVDALNKLPGFRVGKYQG